MASEKGSRKPNLILRRVREEERQESRAEFAAALASAAHEMGEPVEPSERYIARLEDGDIAYPNPAYRRVLIRLCGRSIDELGFVRRQRPRVAEAAGASLENGAVTLWHPAAASELAPDPDLYARITSVLEEESRPDSAVISWLERCLAEHRRLEDETGSGPIVGVVQAQLSVVTKVAREAPVLFADRVVALTAQYAQFMAWLCNDQGDKAAALAWYDRAHDWAMEAGDTDMAATTLSMKAHLAWSVGNAARCVRLGEAARWSDDRTTPGVQGMAAQMIARGHAIGSNRDGAHRAINEAQSLIVTAAERPEDEPPWLYFYDETWFTAQRGMIEMELASRGKGDPGYAVNLLERALNGLPEYYRRDRAWYGTVLARAYAISDDCDAAADTGVKFAPDAIDVNRYAFGELKQLSTALRRRGVHRARELADALYSA